MHLDPVLVQTDVGPLWIAKSDQVMRPWMEHYGTWETDEAALLRSWLKPGNVAIDIGANVGYHTRIMARAVGEKGMVFAIEPHPGNATMLRENILAAGLHRVVQIRQVAAMADRGDVTLSLSPDNEGDHRIGDRPAHRSVRVAGVPLDDVIPPHLPIHVVKSDIQGYDHVAIRGLSRTIERWHPKIVAEFWPDAVREAGDDPIEVLSYYRSLGYALSLLEVREVTDDADILEAAAGLETGFGTLILEPVSPVRSRSARIGDDPVDLNIRILDLFGLPRYGGGVTLHCQWRIPPELAQLAGRDPIHLAPRVRVASHVRLAPRVRRHAGPVIVENGPRSLPISARQPEHQVFVPLSLPPMPGRYDVEIDAVVEHKFWASWHGVEPAVLRVERFPNGDLRGIDEGAGRSFDVRWTASSGTPFRIPHPRYGADDSERAVEIPWALSRYRGERRVLDVGYAYAEPRYHEALAALRIPTLVGIDLAAVGHPGVHGIVGDVRHPPLRAGSLDLAIAISVIEHIGRDNTVYSASDQPDPREADGDFRAVAALGALLAPGGRLLVTVPFGVAEDHGWFIQYDARRLDQLVRASGLAPVEADYFRYEGAWRGPEPRDQLAECRYGIGATAAAGLACLALQRRHDDRPNLLG